MSTDKKTKRLRCAIYTRKSHDEGLEQEFNSLDAQREAGVAYIQSQKHEGWSLIATNYDDGGYSGGTMERPALKLLMKDVAEQKIDVIIVYKVDRLSRSLHDFAQMMNVFDQYQVSFVSVTQPFNTTTSMGRLTLNVLLSFAQFEREVTGERIRDKIAASKRKGMWMGGMPPLGYRVEEKTLVIETKEAELIKTIFTEYQSHQSLLKIADTLNEQGFTTKKWQADSERWHGGKPLTPKYINRLLTNPIYIGKVAHRKEIHNGQHKPIVDYDLWQSVQDLINSHERSNKNRMESFYLLKGKVRTYEGFAMSPSSTMRSRSRINNKTVKEKVLYYVSQKALNHGYKSCLIKTLNAKLLDGCVSDQIRNYLQLEVIDKQETLRDVINNVVVAPEKLVITLDKEKIVELQEKTEKSADKAPTVFHQSDIKESNGKIILTVRICIKRVNGIQMLLTSEGRDLALPAQPKPNKIIVQAIGRAWSWRESLQNEPALTIKKLAARCGYTSAYLRHHLTLIGLAPDIIQRALTGTLPSVITLDRLQEAAESLSWDHQRELLGLN
jgi:DNA invertase Pin-like site-specific DNA recombinase